MENEEMNAKIYKSLAIGEYTRLKLCDELGIVMPTIKKRLVDGKWKKLELEKLTQIFG